MARGKERALHARVGGVTNGGISYWYSEIGLPKQRDPLPGDLEADICIVGAGFTGLWTAYYLKREQPELRVVVVEKEFAGFGASGRNGGWLSSQLSGSRERYAAAHGRASVIDLLHAMRLAVDEVINVASAENIDANIAKDGLLRVARTTAQVERLHKMVEYERSWGATPDDLRLLTMDELNDRVVVEGARAAVFGPHAARVQPARLVQGLAAAVERMGVRIFEQTVVREITPHTARTDHGTVTAPIVLRCLEGFTPSIKGHRRAWLPMNSSMIITEPLQASVIAKLGWSGAELLGDFSHAYFYAQRTADNRIAIGGRGIPYRFGSRTDDYGNTQEWTVKSLTNGLHDMFPETREVAVAHAWCGVLGVPRDWCATVNLDPNTGLGEAGGYVGSGLTATNLAGRTLADLVLQRDTELTRLPWVGRQARKWEPEPLRWLGVQAMYQLYRMADKREENHDLPHTSRTAGLANKITGR